MVHHAGRHLQAHLQGHNDVAHCLPYTLASWDCQDRTEVLCQEGRLGAAQSSHKKASRPRRRSRNSSRHCSRMAGLKNRSRHSSCSPPNMPPRCHCGEPLTPSSNTMPKFSSAMNIPAYAWSSCSAGGWPRPPLTMMKQRRMTSRPRTPQYAMWLDETGAAMGNWLWSKWRLLGEVQPGSHLSRWTSVKRSLRPWRRSTLTGEPCGGYK